MRTFINETNKKTTPEQQKQARQTKNSTFNEKT